MVEKTKMCPLWTIGEDNFPVCDASNEYCDFNVGSIYWMCSLYKNLREIFEDDLGIKEVDIDGMEQKAKHD